MIPCTSTLLALLIALVMVHCGVCGGQRCKIRLEVNVEVTLKGSKAMEDLLEEERVSMLLMRVAIMPQFTSAELLATHLCFVSSWLHYLGSSQAI